MTSITKKSVSKLEDDIDETLLDEDSGGVEKRYEKSQRELVTQTVDFNIKNLAQMVTSKQIDTNPKYQRRLRWDDERQSKLIESFLLNVPIPPLFLAEEEYGKYAVIDGQQRLRTLSSFFSNLLTLTELEVFSEINGLRFEELPFELQTILSMRPTQRCIIILRQSHPEIKFEVFERLNTGGVKLNAQEIRNSAFRGPMNDLILELSENIHFRKLLNIKNPKTSKIVQYMRDCELILRFFALKDCWRRFPGSLKQTLNKFMEDNQKADAVIIENFKNQFIKTLDLVEQLFGEHAFHRYDTKKSNWVQRQILASLFDAQMLACYELSNSDIPPIRYSIANEDLKKIFNEKDFLDAIGAGTNQKSKIINRVEKIINIVQKENI